MTHIIKNTIYDYKMPESMYKDLKSNASANHNSIKKEIYYRLTRTLDPEYNFKSNKTILNYASTLCSDKSVKTITFDFNVPNYLVSTITLLRTHRPDIKDLLYEINLRLAYTLYDPFYK